MDIGISNDPWAVILVQSRYLGIGMEVSFKKFAVIHGRAWGSLFKNETSTARSKGHHFATAGGEVSQCFAFRLLGHQPPQVAARLREA
jgi:hypothetical protein